VYRIIEKRMVAEWCFKHYPDDRIIIRCWLGPVEHSTALARAGVTPRVLMPFAGGWADAIILGPDWARIVEACVVADTRHVGALEGYIILFRKTREFKHYWDKPVIGVLLYGYPRKVAIDLAKAKGYETVQFRPDYVKEYYEEKVGL